MIRNKSIALAVLPVLLVGFFLFALPADVNAQDHCCNNNSVNQCVPAMSVGQCSGAALQFFVDGVDGIVLTNPQCTGGTATSGDLCDPPAGCPPPPPTKQACKCIDAQGAVVDCVDIPPPPTGCCAIESPLSCNAGITEGACEAISGFLPGDWQPGIQTCNSIDQCAAEPPTGCCAIESPLSCNAGIIEVACEAIPGFLPGDWQIGVQTCNSIDQCAGPPTGCCVLAPEDCIVTNEDSCGADGGEYQGDGKSCDDVPECQPEPPIVTNVPTISQWGMIAMAGLLGIFSLLIIMRRHRYNVS
jgi:IPTL-CTERM motif